MRGNRRPAGPLSAAVLLFAAAAVAQVLPDEDLPVVRPELLDLTCPARTWTMPPSEAVGQSQSPV